MRAGNRRRPQPFWSVGQSFFQGRRWEGSFPSGEASSPATSRREVTPPSRAQARELDLDACAGQIGLSASQSTHVASECFFVQTGQAHLKKQVSSSNEIDLTKKQTGLPFRRDRPHLSDTVRRKRPGALFFSSGMDPACLAGRILPRRVRKACFSSGIDPI